MFNPETGIHCFRSEEMAHPCPFGPGNAEGLSVCSYYRFLSSREIPLARPDRGTRNRCSSFPVGIYRWADEVMAVFSQRKRHSAGLPALQEQQNGSSRCPCSPSGSVRCERPQGIAAPARESIGPAASSAPSWASAPIRSRSRTLRRK